MKFIAFRSSEDDQQIGLAVENKGIYRGLKSEEEGYPGDLLSLIQKGEDALAHAAQNLANGPQINLDDIELLPPVSNAEKVVCVGLNYVDHSAESGFETPTYPTLFGRFNSSLIGHGAPIRRPVLSEQLDYEGELVAIIGKTARNVSVETALDHVIGYSIFNDASIRDYQFKAPQWTPGKNFDDTGAFGPCMVTSDALPPGAKGLQLTTKLNGEVVQSASTDDMVFSVGELISLLSQFMTLKPGDILVTGTPSGVGLARDPQLFMKHGDKCEVEIEQIGILSNPVLDQEAS